VNDLTPLTFEPVANNVQARWQVEDEIVLAQMAWSGSPCAATPADGVRPDQMAAAHAAAVFRWEALARHVPALL
jgi:hypothetical protein